MSRLGCKRLAGKTETGKKKRIFLNTIEKSFKS
jgi:hypothetical protein